MPSPASSRAKSRERGTGSVEARHAGSCAKSNHQGFSTTCSSIGPAILDPLRLFPDLIHLPQAHVLGSFAPLCQLLFNELKTPFEPLRCYAECIFGVNLQESPIIDQSEQQIPEFVFDLIPGLRSNCVL